VADFIISGFEHSGSVIRVILISLIISKINADGQCAYQRKREAFCPDACACGLAPDHSANFSLYTDLSHNLNTGNVKNTPLQV
jgi:hypothetical protein